jgi:peptidoglycan/xylan/chitin deacetylase (PgdA/CDA1 family)
MRRQIARRRAIAVLSLVAIGVGITLAVGFTGGKPSKPATTTKAEAPPPPAHFPAIELRRPRTAAAVARFVRMGLPIYCGGHRGRYVALTFDDGPGPATVRTVLPLLRRANARATFFVVGQNIARRAGALRQERTIGAIGNHTWSHAKLTELSAAGVSSQLTSTQRAIERAAGRRPNLFRPPYGARDATVDAAARSLGLAEILWSIDSYDSRGFSTKDVAHTVLKLVQPGSIVLMHENLPQTYRALPKILRVFKHRRFRLVTVGELLALDPPSRGQLRQGFRGCYRGRATVGLGRD